MARILVAEDEKSLAELVVLNLTDAGHDVTVAEDGRYALKALMQTPPVDLVVLDLVMPWSDGFDVLRNMGSSRPKVVVLTSRDDAYSERRANELGIDAYLVKPYDPEELSATVTRLLGPSTDRR
jgi:DNA-binding response OmpR family regulator